MALLRESHGLCGRFSDVWGYFWLSQLGCLCAAGFYRVEAYSSAKHSTTKTYHPLHDNSADRQN